MNNPYLALIFIRHFPDFFRKQLDQLSIFSGGNAGLARPIGVPLRGDSIRATLPSMRHMVIIVPELTGYASIRHIAVSCPMRANSSTTSNTWSRGT